jgi:hypothetical protein
MKYTKKSTLSRPALAAQAPSFSAPLLGMLYIVEVNVINKLTGEKAKHKLLLVGCELEDIERKMKWLFDTEAESVVVKGMEKVREKVHFLSTIITKDTSANGPVLMRDEGSTDVKQFTPQITEAYDPKLFAVGITTTMLAKDADHALRKVSTALMNRATVGKSHTGAQLHDDSTVVVEEVPMSNGYATARDVSNEANRAHIFRN